MIRALITGLISFGVVYFVPIVGKIIESLINSLPRTLAMDGALAAGVQLLTAIFIWTMLYNAIKVRGKY